MVGTWVKSHLSSLLYDIPTYPLAPVTHDTMPTLPRLPHQPDPRVAHLYMVADSQLDRGEGQVDWL